MMSSSLLQSGCVEYWSWDRNDQQTDVIFQDTCNPMKDQSSDNLSLTFNNNEINYSTDALNSDWHYWEVKLKNTRRNGPSFGLLENTILGVTIGKAVSDIGEGSILRQS